MMGGLGDGCRVVWICEYSFQVLQGVIRGLSAGFMHIQALTQDWNDPQVKFSGSLKQK